MSTDSVQCGRINDSKPQTYKVYGTINNKLSSVPSKPEDNIFSVSIELFNNETNVGTLEGQLTEGTTAPVSESYTDVYNLSDPNSSVIYRIDGGTIKEYHLTKGKYSPKDVPIDVFLFQAVYSIYGNNLTIKPSA